MGDLQSIVRPKVKTLFGILNDLMFFLIIVSFFVFAFGVAVQSILYVNEWRLYPLLMGVLVKPFFSMFGELFLGEYTGYEYSGNVHCPPQCVKIRIRPLKTIFF